MCGHVGFVRLSNNIDSKKLEDVIPHLLLLDSLRGVDGTGIACIQRNKNLPPEVYKKPIPGYDFIDTVMYQRATKDMASIAGVIGHNRAATKGAIIAAATHPFQYGDITLAHNGTLLSMMGLDGNSAVDSERITVTMGNKGVIPTLESLDGSYALVWHDHAANTINFARNKDRPLWLAFSKGRDILFWASEPWMITVSTSRCGIHLEDVGPWELKPLEHNCVALGKPTFEEWTTAPFVEKTYYKAPGGTGNNGQSKHGKDTGATDKPPKDWSKRSNNQAQSAALAGVGLRLGDTINFSAYLVTPYDVSPTYGKLEGFYQKETQQEYAATVITNGVKMDEGIFNNKAADITGMVFSGTVIGGWASNNWTTIIVDNIELVDDGQGTGESEQDPFGFGDGYNGLVEYLVVGPNRKMIPLKEFRQLTIYGCPQCGGNISEAYANKLVWTNDNQAYCHICSEESKLSGIALTNTR